MNPSVMILLAAQQLTSWSFGIGAFACAAIGGFGTGLGTWFTTIGSPPRR